jgi:hypothetical protein
MTMPANVTLPAPLSSAPPVTGNSRIIDEMKKSRGEK